MKKMLFILVTVFLFSGVTFAAEPILVTNTYTEDVTDFPNPERGFYKYTELRTLTSGDVSGLRSQNKTLIYGKVLADDYTNKPFDSTFFNEVKNGLNLARTYGLKVNFRVTYYNELYYTNYLDYDDPPKSLVLQHIQQLEGIFRTNYDVINVVEAGFIGPWGEWHSSSLANTTNRRDVLTNLLNVLPKSRMVAIRCPAYKRDIFGYSPLDNTTAFNGSDIARVGFHNDCFLSDDTDVGTYIFGWSRAQEIAYAGGETRYTPFGGESCGDSSYSDCANAIYEMEQLHATYLNDGYHPDVLNKWVSQGCMDEIKRRLGYRFVLKNMSISSNVKPGGILHIIFHITNVGFAAPYNSRDVELILDNGTKKYTAVIHNTNSILTNTDPRRWLPGKKIVIDKYYRIPYNATETSYKVILNFPDPAPTLHNNPYYSIRLANNGVWESSTGYNVLKTNFQITSSAAGSQTTDTNFVEIDPVFQTNGSVENFKAFIRQEGIYLRWDNPTLPNYVKTILYKSNGGFVSNPSNQTNLIIYQGTGTNYLDTAVTNNHWYYYTIYTVNIFTQYSTPAQTNLYYQDIFKPEKPTGLKGNLSSLNSVELKWVSNTEPDLAGYNIYRSTNDTVFTKINNELITVNNYLDNVGEGVYKYYITAVDTSSNESVPSDTITVTAGIYRVLGNEKVKVAPTLIDLNERDNTYLYFRLENSSIVEIKIYDMYANKKFEEKKEYSSGMHKYRIDFKNFHSGVYIISVRSFEFNKNFKIGVVK